MLGELARQVVVGVVVLGGDNEPAGIFVEAVHDPGPRLAADPRKAGAAMRDQGVHQRAVGIAGRRMDDHSRRFVHDDHVIVLVDDVERDILPGRRRRNRRRHRDFKDVASFDPSGRLRYCLAAERDVARGKQRLQAGPRQLRQGFGQHFVEAHAVAVRSDPDGMAVGTLSRCHVSLQPS